MNIHQYVKCTVFYVALLGPQIKDASSPDCLLLRLEIFAILKIGVDLTKVGNKLGEEGGFPFRLKWGHPTEIFIPQPGFLYLMHPGKGAQKHNTPKVLKHKNYNISFLFL